MIKYLDFWILDEICSWKFGQIVLDTIECLFVIRRLVEQPATSSKNDKTWEHHRLIVDKAHLKNLFCPIKKLQQKKTKEPKVFPSTKLTTTAANRKLSKNTILPLAHRWVYILHFAPGRWSVTGLHRDRKHGWGNALRSHVLRLQSIRLGGQGQQLHAVVWLPERHSHGHPKDASKWMSWSCFYDVFLILFLSCLPDPQRYLKSYIGSTNIIESCSI